MFGVWRMIMKKYIIILLTICLSLSMVACSMNNNVSDSVDTDDIKTKQSFYIWITTLVHTPMFISFLTFFFNENIRWQLLCRISAITVLISIIMIEYQLYKCDLLPRKKSSGQEAAPTDEITDYNPFKK